MSVEAIEVIWPSDWKGRTGLTRDQAAFTRRDVLQAFAEHAREGATVADIESRADAFLARDGIVELVPVSGERRYSTRELLQLEHVALEHAQRRRPAPVAAEVALKTALGSRPSITAEQQELVRALTRREQGVEVVRAPAGTGKTFALDAAREAWQASGAAVLGSALSARAAGELRDQAAIDTTTIARLTYALEKRAQLADGSVLVVDEAGMVGTRDLARLLGAAEQAQAKLVLVGDDRQLPEIQAGGLFSSLADRLSALELTEVRRQREGWDRGGAERGRGARGARGRLVGGYRARRAGADDRPPPCRRRRSQSTCARAHARGRAAGRRRSRPRRARLRRG